MAGHEVRSGNKVRSLDREVAESQVRAGVTAGFFGIVVEISLAILVGVGTDNLDGVLVGTDGTV